MLKKFLFLSALTVILVTTTGFTDPIQPDPPPPPFGPEAILTTYTDEYGNQLDDAISYAFEDISGSGNVLSLNPADNGTGDIPLTFNFKFYGQTNINLLHVSENGFITLNTLVVPLRLTQENKPLPTDSFPNNLVAPFWMDLGLDSGDSTSKVLYSIPNTGDKRVIIQWNNLKVSETQKVTFEAIIYETGVIYFVYKPITVGSLSVSAGIEDADGLDGINYAIVDLTSGKSVRITPPGAGEHVKARPQVQSGYINTTLARFMVTITNTTTSGITNDRYTLSSSIESTYPLGYGWTVEFFDASCTNQITSFGPLAKGSSAVMCVQVTAGNVIQVGYHARIRIDLVSNANPNVYTKVYLQVAVSAAFTQLYRDGASSLKLDLTTPKLGEITIVESAFVGNNHMAFTMLWPNEYMAAWRNGNYIQYRLFRRYAGSFSSLHQIPGGQQNAGHPINYSPAIAATEDGHIGVLYLNNIYRVVNVSGEDHLQVNSNVNFALLDREGTLLSGYPKAMTSNIEWFDIKVGGDKPQYLRPTLTWLDSDRFFLAWQKNYTEYDLIEYKVFTTTGETPLSSEVLGWDDTHRHVYPMTLRLRDGNILVAFVNYSGVGIPAWPVSYTVLDASGDTVKDVTAIPAIPETKGYQIDVEQMSDGTIIFAWSNLINSKIAYAALAEDYVTLLQAPTDLDYFDFQTHTNYRRMSSASVTHDAEGHAIITWQDFDWQEQLYYAMLGPTGVLLTQSMLYRRVGSTYPLSQISTNNLGNAPLAIERLYLPAMYH
jgi:hypothetical protein